MSNSKPDVCLVLKGFGSGLQQPLTGDELFEVLQKLKLEKRLTKVMWDGDPLRADSFTAGFPGFFQLLGESGSIQFRATKAIDRGHADDFCTSSRDTFLRDYFPHYTCPDFDVIGVSIDENGAYVETYSALGMKSMQQAVRGAEEQGQALDLVVLCQGGGSVTEREFEVGCETPIPATWHVLDLKRASRLQPDKLESASLVSKQGMSSTIALETASRRDVQMLTLHTVNG